MTNNIHPDLPDEDADERMVEIAAESMSEKLAQKRSEGCGGWHREECTTGQLRDLLSERLEKCDMVGVLNYAGMILAREKAGL